MEKLLVQLIREDNTVAASWSLTIIEGMVHYTGDTNDDYSEPQTDGEQTAAAMIDEAIG